MRRIQVIDSHTGGEPTRLVIAGGPDLGSGPLSQRLEQIRHRHDRFRQAVVNEPRGSDVLVGGLLCSPHEPDCTAGILFFNNVGYLGMCGHGTIGLMATLAHLDRLGPGRHRLDTAVGVVAAELHPDGRVSVDNVASCRYASSVTVEVPGHGRVTGDVAWGGNWFFLLDEPGLSIAADGAAPDGIAPENVEALTDFCWRIRRALATQGVTGENGAEIDHIELSSPSQEMGVDSRNFVLCPGKAYDRSPCGTGTSAKLACLIADGRLEPGEVYRQQSVTGSIFEATATFDPERPGWIRPRVTGRAHLTAEATLLVDPRDPLGWGMAG